MFLPLKLFTLPRLLRTRLAWNCWPPIREQPAPPPETRPLWNGRRARHTQTCNEVTFSTGGTRRGWAALHLAPSLERRRFVLLLDKSPQFLFRLLLSPCWNMAAHVSWESSLTSSFHLPTPLAVCWTEDWLRTVLWRKVSEARDDARVCKPSHGWGAATVGCVYVWCVFVCQY